MYVDLRVEFPQGGRLYHDDPALGDAAGAPATSAMMGDIVHLPQGGATLKVDVLGSAPIEKVEIFDGPERLEIIRPYVPEDLGNRIRVIWEGAEYRGRFRQVIWDGKAVLSDNAFVGVRPVNFFNPEKTLDRVSETELHWRALTTGNFGGFDAWVRDAYAGTLKIETPLVGCEVPLEKIGYEEEIVDASGVLPRFVRMLRLPAENPHRTMTITREVPLRESGDTALFIKLTQEDGDVAWTSPIYLFR